MCHSFHSMTAEDLLEESVIDWKSRFE